MQIKRLAFPLAALLIGHLVAAQTPPVATTDGPVSLPSAMPLSLSVEKPVADPAPPADTPSTATKPAATIPIAPIPAATTQPATPAPSATSVPSAKPVAEPATAPAAEMGLPKAPAKTATKPKVKPMEAAEVDAATAPRIIRGTDRVIGPAKPALSSDGPSSSFKFEEAPLADVAQIVLRDMLKVDHVLHPPVNGTVTLTTRAEVTPDQAMAFLESALQANGLLMARDTRGVYHVGRPEALKGIVPAVRQAGSEALPPGYGAIVVPLQYIGAGEMAAILRPMVPAEALVRVDSVRNLLVLVGTRVQAEGWLDIVSTFDVDLLKGMSVGVFPLKYASTREVEAAMRLLSPGAGAPAAPAPGAAAGGAGGGGGAPAAAQADAAFLFGAVRVVPIERINSILVVTPRAAYLDQAREWIERLDKPSSNSAEPQLFVYAVQNGSAKHLSNVLAGLFGAEGAQAANTGSGVAPGLNPVTAGTAGFGGAASAFPLGTTGAQGFGGSMGGLPGNLGSFGFSGATNRNNSPVSGTGVTSANLLRGVKVIADEINNAVLVYGTAADYRRIEATLKRLDIPPTQVLIEASIIEVSLNDDLQYGLQWFFTDKKRDGNTGTGVISNLGGGVLGAAQSGFSYTLRNPLGNVRAVLNALADKSLIKVISSPSLMVLDNHQAFIAVGNQQPVQSGQLITTGGNISNSIQFKDTGVNLAVTPSVNSGNLVTMQINQSVTDVGQIDAATGQRSFLQRQINSKVAVRSGETLVLGGLIRDNTITGKSGVPFLQDIPVVGSLFGTTTVTTDRTELLVIITPRVVRTEVETRALSQELRERMQGFSGQAPALRGHARSANALSGSAGESSAAEAASAPSLNGKKGEEVKEIQDEN